MIRLATFAGGCFWGIENYFKKQFGNAIETKVGYIGGVTKSPTYNSVCLGTTNHAEALQIKYNIQNTDPNKFYEDLVTFFFRIHDPTTTDQQGNDIGTQYRSAVFYHDEEQKKIVQKVIEIVQPKFRNKIVTKLEPASEFYEAEDYHQNYLEKNTGGYCNHGFKW